jgi:hypothetical protein
LEPSQHLLKDRGKPRNPVTKWPVAGPSGCTLTFNQQSGKKNMGHSFSFAENKYFIRHGQHRKHRAKYLPSRCLAMVVSFGSTIPDFKRLGEYSDTQTAR